MKIRVTEEPPCPWEGEVTMLAMTMAETCWVMAGNRAGMGAEEPSSTGAWAEMDWVLLIHNSNNTCNNRLPCMARLTWEGAMVVTCMECREGMVGTVVEGHLNNSNTNNPMANNRASVEEDMEEWEDLKGAMTSRCPMASMAGARVRGWPTWGALVSSNRCRVQGSDRRDTSDMGPAAGGGELDTLNIRYIDRPLCSHLIFILLAILFINKLFWIKCITLTFLTNATELVWTGSRDKDRFTRGL